MKPQYSGPTIIATWLICAASATAQSLSWDKQINSTDRFRVLAAFGGAAVLDRETGLVWERSPNPSTTLGWLEAQLHCNNKTVGNRKGWRLPTIQELSTLVDPTVPPFSGVPVLPIGHPFANVPVEPWSSTRFQADGLYFAWGLLTLDGSVGGDVQESPRSAWCVRGGSGVDFQ